MTVLIDRVPGKPGRVLVTPENGGEAFYATLELADEPVVTGNKVNRQNVIDTVNYVLVDTVDVVKAIATNGGENITTSGSTIITAPGSYIVRASADGFTSNLTMYWTLPQGKYLFFVNAVGTGSHGLRTGGYLDIDSDGTIIEAVRDASATENFPTSWSDPSPCGVTLTVGNKPYIWLCADDEGNVVDTWVAKIDIIKA